LITINPTAKDALTCALRGNLKALWVPPIGAMLHTLAFAPFPGSITVDYFTGMYISLGLIAIYAALAGAAWLLALGVPVLFCLNLARLNHPLIAAVAGGSAMYLFYSGNAAPTTIGAVTTLVAAIYARSSLELRSLSSPSDQI
jgi:hypothetical protein